MSASKSYESDQDDAVFSDKDSEGNVTYVKPIKTLNKDTKPAGKNSKHVNPKTYLEMVLEAIEKLQGRNGVSRNKICNYIARQFNVADVSSLYVTKALRSALQKKLIDNTTGSGANGSFKLTKVQKAIRKKSESDNTKKENQSAKNKVKLKQEKNTSKIISQSKDDMELVKSKKADGKKIPLSKDKENGKVAKEMQMRKSNKTKKIMEKSFSTGDIKNVKEMIHANPEPDEEKKPTNKKLKDSTITSRKRK